MDKAVSPNALSKQLGIDCHKVLAWIRTGQLKAVNLAESTSGRPRWKILPEDLQQFLAARSSHPATPPVRRRKKRPLVKEYY